MARMYPERPVVILTELDNINEDFSNVEELLYVGVSRAMAHLIVIGEHPLGDFPAVILKRISKG